MEEGKSMQNKTKEIESFPGGSNAKESGCNLRDQGSIPGLGRSPGEGNGSPLWCSCPENLMDRGAWRATVLRVSKSWTRLKRLSTHAHIYAYVVPRPNTGDLTQKRASPPQDFQTPRLLQSSCPEAPDRRRFAPCRPAFDTGVISCRT